MRIKEIEITGNEIKMASRWIDELFQKNDQLIQKMIDWYMKDWPYQKKVGANDRAERKYVEGSLKGSGNKREEFYQAFKENCQDEVLQKEVFKALKEFMERKC